MRSQLAVRIGHHWPILITGVFAAITAMDITTTVQDHRAWNGAAVVAIPAIFATGFVGGRHDRTHCLRCARNFPLNAPEVAQRRRRALWAYHVAHSSLGRCAVLIAAVVASSLLAAVYVGDSVWTAYFVAVAWSTAAHRPVQAWCPWCHRDDGGDDEIPTPEPDPAGRGSRHA